MDAADGEIHAGDNEFPRVARTLETSDDTRAWIGYEAAFPITWQHLGNKHELGTD